MNNDVSYSGFFLVMRYALRCCCRIFSFYVFTRRTYGTVHTGTDRISWAFTSRHSCQNLSVLSYPCLKCLGNSSSPILPNFPRENLTKLSKITSPRILTAAVISAMVIALRFIAVVVVLSATITPTLGVTVLSRLSSWARNAQYGSPLG